MDIRFDSELLKSISTPVAFNMSNDTKTKNHCKPSKSALNYSSSPHLDGTKSQSIRGRSFFQAKADLQSIAFEKSKAQM